MTTRTTSRIRDVLTCGGLTLDTIFRVARIPPPHFEAEVFSASQKFGGRAPNVAYTGARLGLQTGVLSPVGNDFDSSGYRVHLQRARVDLSGILTVRRQPTTKIYLFDDGTGHTITFFQLGASNAFRTLKVSRGLVSRYAIVHISSSGSTEFNLRAATVARSAGSLVSFDPGNDPSIEEPEYVRQMLQKTSFVFANRKELPLLLNATNASEPRGLLMEQASVVAVIDKTDLRAEVHTLRGSYQTPKIRAKVVDLTGASDGFAAGFLFGHQKGCDTQTAAKIGVAVMSSIVEAWGSQDGAPSLVSLQRRYHRLFGQRLSADLTRQKPNT